MERDGSVMASGDAPGAPRAFDGVVCLGPFPWSEVWQTPHYVARHLSCRVPVLYVEPAPQWHPFGGAFSSRQLRRMLGTGRLRTEEGGLDVVTPRSVPFGRVDLARRTGTRLYVNDVRAACRARGLLRPLLWVFADDVERLRGLETGAYVYHVLDLYRETASDAQVARDAAVVFAASDRLVEKYRRLSGRCQLLPNGVETEWFKPADGVGRPRVLARSGRPVLGYTGTISRHTDVSLLVAVSRAFAEADVIVIGPLLKGPHGPQGQQRQALRTLQRMKNVTFLGCRPAWTLPDYIGAFDVCLVPAIRDAWAAHSDPLKFYQYLAMGRPVVSTGAVGSGVPAALYYEADSHDTFMAQVRRALQEVPSPDLARRRYEAIEARSWKATVAHAIAALEDLGCRLPVGPETCR
jgi:glycosyltransferase involved in cell wall biosynthesis